MHIKALISRDAYGTPCLTATVAALLLGKSPWSDVSSFQQRGLQTPRGQGGNLLGLRESCPRVLVCRLSATTPISLLGWIYQPVALRRKVPAHQETSFHGPYPVLQCRGAEKVCSLSKPI